MNSRKAFLIIFYLISAFVAGWYSRPAKSYPTTGCKAWDRCTSDAHTGNVTCYCPENKK